MYVYLKVSHTVFHGTYFQASVYRVAVLGCNSMRQIPGNQWKLLPFAQDWAGDQQDGTSLFKSSIPPNTQDTKKDFSVSFSDHTVPHMYILRLGITSIFKRIKKMNSLLVLGNEMNASVSWKQGCWQHFRKYMCVQISMSSPNIPNTDTESATNI